MRGLNGLCRSPVPCHCEASKKPWQSQGTAEKVAPAIRLPRSLRSLAMTNPVLQSLCCHCEASKKPWQSQGTTDKGCTRHKIATVAALPRNDKSKRASNSIRRPQADTSILHSSFFILHSHCTPRILLANSRFSFAFTARRLSQVIFSVMGHSSRIRS